MHLSIDPASLTPLIKTVVEETVAQLERDRQQVGERLAYSEAEAARLLGLNVHQLRDERLRGRIQASQVVLHFARFPHTPIGGFPGVFGGCADFRAAQEDPRNSHYW